MLVQSISAFLLGASVCMASMPAYAFTLTAERPVFIPTEVDEDYVNPHAVTAIGDRTFTYDRNGNVLTDIGGALPLENTWSYRNELIGTNILDTEAGESVEYRYDTSGIRVYEEEQVGSRTTFSRLPTSAYVEVINPNGATKSTISLAIGGIPVASIQTEGTSTPQIYHTHTDHLRSTRQVTSDTGTVVETTDYRPFGAIKPSGYWLNSSSSPERRKFTSHEFDDTTNYTYAKARYLDTGIGRFISQDPAFWEMSTELLTDPQQQNAYGYARNNPLRYIDPDGKLNIVIAGTWGKGWENWQSNNAMSTFVNSVTKTFSVLGGGTNTWVEAIPELRDNGASRAAVAERIAGKIGEYQFASGETLNIIGHSHGGNVAALLSQLLNRKIDNLVTLGTPIRSDYQFNEGNIGSHVNAYSKLDFVQVFGGRQTRGLGILLGLGGFSACGLVCAAGAGIIGSQTQHGEIGFAGRRLSGDGTDVDVTKEAGFISPHKTLWRDPAIWGKISTYFSSE